MKNREIRQKIIKEIEQETPDVLDSILLDCNEKEKVMENKKTKKSIFAPLSVALACVVLLIGVITFGGYNILYKTDAIIEFDVNPSIELKINSRGQITEARALNEDGKKILSDMNLENSDLNVGVNAIIGSMLKEGYISDIKNSVLVSVNSKNKVEANKLQKSLSNEIDKILKAYSINSSVITQNLDLDDQIEKKAKEAGISEGKAEYIENIMESGLTNKKGEKYTFETLAKLSINELNAIVNSKNKTPKNTKSTGKASTKNYIGYDKAKQIALSNAGLSAKNVRDLEVELDYDYGKMIYEVSFETASTEYEYDIDAVTGKIINKEIEEDDDYRENKSSTVSNKGSSSKNTKKSTNKSSSSKGTKKSTNKSSSSNSNKSSSNTTYIGLSRAKQIALSNAGASSGARELEAELDYENGRAIYEVSFKYNGNEYDYDIDAVKGTIISKNVERDD